MILSRLKKWKILLRMVSKGRPVEKTLQVRIISKRLTNAPNEIEKTNGSLDERANMSILLGLLLLRLVLHLHLSPVFFFSLPYIFHFLQVSSISAFQIEAEKDFLLDLSFLDQTTPTPQHLIRPPSDSDMAFARSTVSHLLGLDLLSLSTSKKDAFCATLAVLASTSKVPRSKVFILEALAQTFSIFPTLDRALKSNMEISSTLDALKRQKTKFYQAQLAKKHATQRLNKLCTEYDTQKERINMWIEDLEKKK